MVSLVYTIKNGQEGPYFNISLTITVVSEKLKSENKDHRYARQGDSRILYQIVLTSYQFVKRCVYDSVAPKPTKDDPPVMLCPFCIFVSPHKHQGRETKSLPLERC